MRDWHTCHGTAEFAGHCRPTQTLFTSAVVLLSFLPFHKLRGTFKTKEKKNKVMNSEVPPHASDDVVWWETIKHAALWAALSCNVVVIRSTLRAYQYHDEARLGHASP